MDGRVRRHCPHAGIWRSRLAAATRACDAAPTRGAAHACGFSLWMDIYDQHMVLGAWQAFASLPTAPWLEVDLKGEGAAAATSTHTIHAPCDTAAYPAACFARHFHKPLLAPRPGKPPMAPLPLAAHCVAEPMASERHVVGCVFGVSLNAYPRQLGTRGALAAWCSVFVERAARARPDAVPSEERAPRRAVSTGALPAACSVSALASSRPSGYRRGRWTHIARVSSTRRPPPAG